MLPLSLNSLVVKIISLKSTETVIGPWNVSVLLELRKWELYIPKIRRDGIGRESS